MVPLYRQYNINTGKNLWQSAGLVGCFGMQKMFKQIRMKREHIEVSPRKHKLLWPCRER